MMSTILRNVRRHRSFCATVGLLMLAWTLTSCVEPRTSLVSDDLFVRPSQAANRFDLPFMSLEGRRSEVATKLARVRQFLNATDRDGLLLTRENMFGWITAGGENFIVHATDQATAKVLITPNAAVVITSNIEADRLRDEVVKGLEFTVEEFKYYVGSDEAERIAAYCPDLNKIVTDGAVIGGMQALEMKALLDLLYPLTPQEVQRYRWLGRKSSEIVERVADVVRPGMTEFDIQYLLAREFWYWDILPTVNLASVDERVRTYKHPFPEGTELKNYVNLNICARRWGMIISMSRLLYLGEPGADLRRVFDVGGRVMASMLHVTRPGNTFSQVLKANEEAYAEGGFPLEWQRHLQGGPILTGERVTLLRTLPDGVIRSGMTLAYNPTCKGSKHEDTFLVTDAGLEMLTPCIRWPTRRYEIDGRTYDVPDLKIVPIVE